MYKSFFNKISERFQGILFGHCSRFFLRKIKYRMWHEARHLYTQFGSIFTLPLKVTITKKN